MRYAAAFLAIFLSSTAEARPYDEIMSEARSAFETEDFIAAGKLLDEAQADRPYSLFLTRNRVLTRILTDRMDEAIAIVKEVADRGLVLETPPNEAFDRMRNEPAFASIAAQMAANGEAKGDALIRTEYPESGLLPEAISLSKGRMLIGSVRTGAIAQADASLLPFAKLDGGVFDIEQRKNAVFAVVNNQLAYEKRGDAPPFAAIVELDPKTGEERSRIRINAAEVLLGDIEIGKRGAIYASDSLQPRIFAAARGDQDASVFSSDARFANLQGLALDEKHNRLFAADYLTGLFAIDLTSGKAEAIANPTNAHLGGIDGLYLYKGDLIGVQNGTSPQRIVKIDLDKTGLTALSLEVLQQALPEWNEPTHGVIDGGNFVYIASSNWPAYDDEGNLREDASLAPLKIMTLPLNR